VWIRQLSALQFVPKERLCFGFERLAFDSKSKQFVIRLIGINPL
jgi:hypothetical protein